MYSIGTYATDIHTGKTIQIVGVQQVFGAAMSRIQGIFIAHRRRP